MDQPERVRADRDASDQKNRNIGNPDPLRQQRGQRADREDQAARQQRVLGDQDRG